MITLREKIKAKQIIKQKAYHEFNELELEIIRLAEINTERIAQLEIEEITSEKPTIITKNNFIKINEYKNLDIVMKETEETITKFILLATYKEQLISITITIYKKGA